MQNAQNAHRVAGHVINHNVVCVGHQFGRTGDAAKPANVWARGQLARSSRNNGIERERRGEVIWGNIGPDSAAVVIRKTRPDESHAVERVRLRRVLMRQALASASTSSAATVSPTVAALRPACTERRSQASCDRLLLRADEIAHVIMQTPCVEMDSAACLGFVG